MHNADFEEAGGKETLEKKEERRKSPRYSTDLSARFRLISRADLAKCESTYHTGRIKDISLLGMRIETPVRLPVGQEVELYAEGAFTDEGFFAIVQTVRFVEKEAHHETGVSIIEKEVL
jgi:hypothetical protein